MDVHSKWTTIAGFDPGSGEIVRIDRVSNEAIGAALSELDGPLHGIMEVGTNSWAMYRVLFSLRTMLSRG
jgi:hypothetical protein